MATAKFTIQRGKMQPKDIIVAAGTAEAQSDTLSLNIDFTLWRRGDVILALESMIAKIQRGKDIPA
jgi:hypothetical protein